MTKHSWAGAGALLLMSSLGTGCADDSPDCDVPGVACTWAGRAGELGFNGDGRDKLDTKFHYTMDMIFASDGTPWFIDWNNHLVRKIEADDTVTTVLGVIDSDSIFPGDGGPGENTEQGAIGTEVALNHPTDLAETTDGTILVMAWHNHKLRKIDPTSGRGKIVCGAGAGFAGDNGPATGALFRQPKALEVSPQGDMFILDQQNFRIRKIDGAGIITTVAGNGMKMFAGDGGPALDASFDFEAGSNPEPSGGLAMKGDKLYVSDTMSHRIRVVDLTTGLIDTIAGTGVAGGAGDDGPALSAQLNGPRDLEIGPEGDLYVADTDNSRIRAINLETGIIRAVAGTGEIMVLRKSDEGKPARKMALWRPWGITFDPDGNLYIMDTINSRIVRVAR